MLLGLLAEGVSTELMTMGDLLPRVSFQKVELDIVNGLLTRWGHLMGEVNRPFPSIAYALFEEADIVAVTVHACLIRDHPGGVIYLNRTNSVELARLCAERTNLCRVALRLWREFVFPALGKRYAVSYQDLDAHTGSTYRLDGWRDVGVTSSGTDQRSGKKGRRKKCWIWENDRLPTPTQARASYEELMPFP